MAQVNLSNVSVDFEALLEELTTDLQTKGTWKDLLLSSTGTALLEYAASVGVFNQFNIELSFRETALHKAIRDSSIYGIARTLGVSIPRKSPSIVDVEITNNGQDDIYITPKSKFLMTGNRELFNPNQINIASGQTATVVLKEGTILRKVFELNTLKYQEYLLGEPGFVVTDADVSVILRDKLSGSEEYWTKSDSAIWMHGSTDKIYFESTTEDGDVSIIFGDGVYGMAPPSNHQIIVDYAITSGDSGSTNFITSTVIYSKDSNLTGKVKSYYEQGAAQKESLYYKLYAAHMFKSRNRAVSKTDYISIILGHSDVAGVTVQAQRDLYPNDPKWMNTIRICVLASGLSDTFGGVNPNPISSKWTDFLNWLQPKMGWIKIQTWNPTKNWVNITVKVGLQQSADALDSENSIRKNIIALFKKDMYSLGKTTYLSDIVKACQIEGVDYVVVDTPTANVVPADDYTFNALGNLNVEIFYSERTSLPTYKQ